MLYVIAQYIEVFIIEDVTPVYIKVADFTPFYDLELMHLAIMRLIVRVKVVYGLINHNDLVQYI